jgi:hypothetical protein
LVQTIPDPQSLPAGRLPISVQTALPVEHCIFASRQGLPGTTQEAPSAHATQEPDKHTIPAPHGVPSDWFIAVSRQVAVASPSQVTTPT